MGSHRATFAACVVISPLGGRPPVGNREALTGILFIRKTGMACEDLPQELGCGCGRTCFRRLMAWHEAGVWNRLHQLLLAGQVARSRSLRLDAGDCRQRQHQDRTRRIKTGPNPTDRGKCGSKHHVLTDGQGVPLAATLTVANVADVQQLLLAVNAPVLRGKSGRPRSRPDQVVANYAYHCRPAPELLHWLGIDTFIPKHRTQSHGLGRVRCVIERTLSWFRHFRRLRTRYDRRAEVHEAFLQLGCALICWNFLK
jgi:transposase